MKTDSIFYQLFQTAPSIFFELIGQPAARAGYEFRSVEIKQTAFRIDGVFLPAADAPSQTVYFVEVQFQKDQALYQRLFAEIFLYLQQHPTTSDWQAVAIYPQRRLEPGESPLYRALLESPQVQRVYLDELGEAANQSVGVGLVQLVVEQEENAARRARRLIEQAKQETVAGISQQVIIELIETIVIYKFPQLSRQEVEAMLGLSELKQTKVYQEALAEGRVEGREQGLTEGERRVQLRAVPKMLEFGLSVEQVAQALGLDVEAVRQLAQEPVSPDEGDHP